MFQPSVRELLFICKLNKMCLQCHQAFFAILYFSALTLLAGWQEGHPACKKLEWWDAGVFICLERGADLHVAQLMPLPLTVSCFSKIQIGFTFPVLAHPCSPGQRAVKRVCVCVLIRLAHEIWWCVFVCVHQLLVSSTWPSLLRSTL